MKRKFIETSIFQSLVDDFGIIGLEKHIKDTMLETGPENPPIIKGTGGFRKIRISDPLSKRGKSGGYRVIYFDLKKEETTFLFLIYSKSDVENISSSDKKALTEASKQLKKYKNNEKINK